MNGSVGSGSKILLKILQQRSPLQLAGLKNAAGELVCKQKNGNTLKEIRNCDFILVQSSHGVCATTPPLTNKNIALLLHKTPGNAPLPTSLKKTKTKQKNNNKKTERNQRFHEER